MIPISIDISGIEDEFSLSDIQSDELAKSIIDKITVEYTNAWDNTVNNSLDKTRADYKRAMFVERSSNNEITFGLQASKENPLPLMLEEGTPSWDEKEAFARSPKRKQSLGGGWYLTVPFRHSASEDAVGNFASKLPKVIKDIAKAKGSPLTVKDLPEQYRVKGVRKEFTEKGKVIPQYQHKAPQYQGLTRIEASSGEEKSRGKYMTFRRVSSNSDPDSWIHPPMFARKLMDKALDVADISTVADRAIDDYLSELK